MSFVETFDAVRRANMRTRGLVCHYGLDPVWASRLYFMNGVARAIAIDSRGEADGEATVAGISLANLIVLREFFPSDPMVANALDAARRAGSHAALSEEVTGFVDDRRRDGAQRNPASAGPQDPGSWRSMENRPPVRPAWGEVAAFGRGMVAAGRCEPPPEPGSAEHLGELEAVRRAATDPTHAQLAQVLRWACSIGSEAPAGQWQAILEDRLARTLGLEQSLLALTVAEIAMFNAGIACWGTKYRYWFPRPSNLEPRLAVHIHLPNFPSYTSGHAAFSWAAVGSVTELHPELGGDLGELAEDASWSRVLAGVHYPCDCLGGKAAGLGVGKAVAASFKDLRDVATSARENPLGD